jgi:hypothetical protein
VSLSYHLSWEISWGDWIEDIVLTLSDYSCIHCKTCDIKVPDQDIT